MANVTELVQARLPFLANYPNSGTTLISMFEIESFYELQDQIYITVDGALVPMPNDLVEEESSYTNKQLVFFANYIAFKILDQRIMLGLAGDGTVNNEPATNTVLTKGQVDVLSAEFSAVKISDVALGIDTVKLVEKYALQACAQARQNNITLGICPLVEAPAPAFLYIPPQCPVY